MNKQEEIFLNSVFFVLGFTLVFSVVGILFQTLLAHVAISAMNDIRDIGGVLIIVFGIILIASGTYLLPFFSREHKLNPIRFKSSYLSSFVFGIAFAMGWTPCVGPILGSIYLLAATSPGVGFLLLIFYSLGLGIPFIIIGFFISRLQGFMKRIGTFLRYFNVISGLFLIGMGLLIVTGYIGLFSVFLIGPQGVASMNNQLNFLLALIAGVLTFLSPCILPLLPAYFAYMAGTSGQGLEK